jgi:Kv channel-interacting protein
MSFLDSDTDELPIPERYYPESLTALSKATKFTQQEIKRIYRGFKAECPTGMVGEDTFKDIYSQFFPLGGKLMCRQNFVLLSPPRYLV